MDNNRTIVRIAGMEFKLTGDESQQYMDSLAEMVNAKVDEGEYVLSHPAL